MNTTEQADFSNIVGVFQDRAKADQALEALKQANLSNEPPQLTVYNPQDDEAADPALTASDTRFLVHIRAEGKEQDAVGILAHYGANNADIPPGTELVHGSIVRSGEAATLHATPEGTPDTFFGEADNSNIPRG